MTFNDTFDESRIPFDLIIDSIPMRLHAGPPGDNFYGINNLLIRKEVIYGSSYHVLINVGIYKLW